MGMEFVAENEPVLSDVLAATGVQRLKGHFGKFGKVAHKALAA